MTHADNLRVGAELEDRRGDTLIVTDASEDSLTWSVNGDTDETWSYSEVQSALDHGEIELVAEGGFTVDDDGDRDYEPEPLSDTDPAAVAEGDLYVRFGNIPEGERSYDKRNDREEVGVSVYDCYSEVTADDAPDEYDEAYYLSGTMLQTVFVLLHRPTYLVTGEQVDTGADGEPLLRDVEVLAELTTPSGVGGFVVDEREEGQA